MIAFNRNNEDDKSKKIEDKLQKLLDLVFDTDMSSKQSFLDYIGESNIEMNDPEDTDLSKMLDLVYNILFLNNKKELKLLIKREENNSLNIEVLNIK